MNATMEQTRMYTRNEQMDSLRRIVDNNRQEGQRPLARLVWKHANGIRPLNEYMDDSFLRDAAALRGVPWATVYNRIRRITGKIK